MSTWSDQAADHINQITVIAMNGERTQTIVLELPEEEAGDVLSVGHLADKVCRETAIDLWNQEIIFKGQILTDRKMPLSLIGITDGSKVKIRMKQSWFEVTHELFHLKRIEKDIDKTEKHLSGVISKCDGIHRGFYPSEFNVDSLQCYLAVLRQCWQEFKSQLDEINLIDLHDHDSDIKEKGRYLIRRVQTYQNRILGVDSGLRSSIVRMSA